MSKGLDRIGVITPGQISYTTLKLADCFRDIAKHKKIKEEAVPQLVLIDMKEFMELLEDSLSREIPKNLHGSIEAHRTALEILKRTVPTLQNPTEENDELRRYVLFMKHLNLPRALSDEESQVAERLEKFFRTLHQMGDSENYERVVADLQEPPDHTGEPM